MRWSAGLVVFAFAGGAVSPQRPDLVIGDFEQPGYAGWTVAGKAFGDAPHRPDGEALKGYRGAGVAWSGVGGVEAAGTLASPRFVVTRRFVSFLTAGHRDYPSQAGLELVVDDRVVRASSATDHRDPAFHWRTWDVVEFGGRTAQVRVNDRSNAGAIAVDHILQTDEPKSPPLDASRLLGETYRPQFHFTPRAHWTNDPNGLLYYRGQWHLFHQYSYPGARATVWGHALSTDLFGWKHLPVAIPADGDWANFSGSGLVDHANASGLKRGPHDPILLFYTLRPPGTNPPAADDPLKAVQCLAYSTDGGVTFRKYAGNPILRTADHRDRDPKVFFHQPTRAWFMVLSLSANNAEREQARYGLFRAKDLNSWELVQTFGPDGWFWECPDMFELPIDGDPGRTKWLLLKGSGDYILGTFDGAQFRAETGKIRTRWGGNYYATQTFSDAPGGRRVQIGWMNTGRPWEADRYPGMPFNQQMSVPRDLKLLSTSAGPRLTRYPVPEIERLRARTREWTNLRLQPDTNPLAGISHDLLDIDLELELGGARRVTVRLRGEEVIYDAAERKLKAFAAEAPLAPVEGRIRLRILLDRTSIEVFGNGGQVDLSGVFYPDPANRLVALETGGGDATIRRLGVHELRSAFSGK